MLDTACIEFKGSRDDCGYGNIGVKGKHKKAHRVAWEQANGPIPDGMYVCHHCDNPPCINIDHLFLGTQKDNIQDCILKGRKTQVMGEQVGTHKLTGLDILEIRRIRKENPHPFKNGKGPGISNVEIAKMFNVKSSIIGKIINGTQWKHIPV